MKRSLVLVLALAVMCIGLLIERRACAASSQKVDQSVWGVSGLPGYVNMYLYVPDKLSTKPPILVASHHCQGTAASTFSETKSSFVSLADTNGFIIIFPEATGHNCWDVGSAKSLKHDGGGDTHAIAQMVRYTLTKYNADPGRVYAFGGSSGAMMTQALMGVYPDLFAAGVAVSGVPCGCWAVDYSGDVATNGQWSGPCAGGQVSKSAQEWGDLVRSMFVGYTGHRPRLQLWHGTADTTISYKNLAEGVKEWTNLLSLNQTPTTSDTSQGGPHALWKNQCGFGVLETYSVTGAGHGVTWDVKTAASFLGLDKANALDPETAACAPSGVGGAAGASAGGAASGGVAGSELGGGGASGGVGGVMNTGGGVSGVNTAGGAGLAPAGAGFGGNSAGAGGRPGSAGASAGGATPQAAGGASSSAIGAKENSANDASGCSCVAAGHGERRPTLWVHALAALGVFAQRRQRRRARASR